MLCCVGILREEGLKTTPDWAVPVAWHLSVTVGASKFVVSDDWLHASCHQLAWILNLTHRLDVSCHVSLPQWIRSLVASDRFHAGLSCAKVNSSIKEPVKFGFAGSGGFLMVTVPAEAAGLLRQSAMVGGNSADVSQQDLRCRS